MNSIEYGWFEIQRLPFFMIHPVRALTTALMKATNTWTNLLCQFLRFQMNARRYFWKLRLGGLTHIFWAFRYLTCTNRNLRSWACFSPNCAFEAETTIWLKESAPTQCKHWVEHADSACFVHARLAIPHGFVSQVWSKLWMMYLIIVKTNKRCLLCVRMYDTSLYYSKCTYQENGFHSIYLHVIFISI